jgi:DNA-binding transcriptional MerR regulator
VNAPAEFLSSSEAAKRLGVSSKALRLYEQRGLIAPMRSAAGWRAYGPDAMARATEIASLRALGLSLAQVARVLGRDAQGLEPALAAHQATLEGQVRQLVDTVGKVRRLRCDLASGAASLAREGTQLRNQAPELSVSFDLPWPWGGERFDLHDIRRLNYIIGPLGSGKTRLALRIAQGLPDAGFLGLDRFADAGAKANTRLCADPALKSRVDRALDRLIDGGGTASDALLSLLTALEAEAPTVVVIDMLEQGLDKATQEALIAHLRRRGRDARPLFILTRSSAVLNLDAVSADETIILCPANHSPPIRVAPYWGAPGYEAVATCLASPEVRARTEGVIAWRPKVA